MIDLDNAPDEDVCVVCGNTFLSRNGEDIPSEEDEG